jgi:hypothetical protein
MRLPCTEFGLNCDLIAVSTVLDNTHSEKNNLDITLDITKVFWESPFYGLYLGDYINFLLKMKLNLI